MFKVSFKETPNNPSKVVHKAGLGTRVNLKGTVKLPHFWHLMPEEIFDWIAIQNKVDIYENMASNSLTIYSEGISKCMESDKYDTVFAERLAEARAKYCIYKFFYDLCSKLYNYYFSIMFGHGTASIAGEGGSLGRTLCKYKDLCTRESQHIVELLKSKDNE